MPFLGPLSFPLAQTTDKGLPGIPGTGKAAPRKQATACNNMQLQLLLKPGSATLCERSELVWDDEVRYRRLPPHYSPTEALSKSNKHTDHL